MTVADRQQLSELVDWADVAVRAGNQLQLSKLGKAVRDRDALRRAIEFLEAAEAGGAFMSSGDSANLRATLRPLNWAADVQSARGNVGFGVERREVDFDYEALTKLLGRMRSTVHRVLQGRRPQSDDLAECIKFLDSLGEILGTRADQQMRAGWVAVRSGGVGVPA
jgi:hypothetical protein